MDLNDSEKYKELKQRPLGIPPFKTDEKGAVIVHPGEIFCRVMVGTQPCSSNGAFAGGGPAVRSHISKHHKNVIVAVGQRGRGKVSAKNEAAQDFSEAYAAYRHYQTQVTELGKPHPQNNTYSNTDNSMSIASPPKATIPEKRKSISLFSLSDDDVDGANDEGSNAQKRARSQKYFAGKSNQSLDTSNVARVPDTTVKAASSSKASKLDITAKAAGPGKASVIKGGGLDNKEPAAELEPKGNKANQVGQSNGVEAREMTQNQGHAPVTGNMAVVSGRQRQNKNNTDIPTVGKTFNKVHERGQHWTDFFLKKPIKGNWISGQKMREYVGVTANKCRECYKAARKCPDMNASVWAESTCLVLKAGFVQEELQDDEDDEDDEDD